MPEITRTEAEWKALAERFGLSVEDYKAEVAVSNQMIEELLEEEREESRDK